MLFNYELILPKKNNKTRIKAIMYLYKQNTLTYNKSLT